ncbi:hypothetical protein BKA93DRAFT_787874 [Sparassis latifolia]
MKAEYFWRNRQEWLQEHGYMLRPRYMPNWKPSWQGSKRSFFRFEDAVGMGNSHIMDATRLSDSRVVTLKSISKSIHPYETTIAQNFSSQPHSGDPRNHCVPVLEVLQDPQDADIDLIVMPMLRPYNNPRFKTVGEVIDFFGQIFDGLQFMHINRVAHRDCMDLNIMLDPITMYPNMYHPRRINQKRDLSGTAKHYSRTERPPQYYLIDFGLSRKYDSDDPPEELPILGGDRSVPEFQDEGYNQPSNPFPTDIYYVGNLIREDFLQVYSGFDFMEALVADMVQTDPYKRPSADQVVTRFDSIRGALSWWKLRAPLLKKDDPALVRFVISIARGFTTIGYIVRRLPPIPTSEPISTFPTRT